MIAIIDYQAGNITSVKNALTRLGQESIITSDKRTIENADKLIFPGVGEAASAMNYLRASALDQTIRQLTQPVLGICLGLQLMCRYSEEGNTNCLNIFDIEVKKFPPLDLVPHMGWNNLTELKGDWMSNITEEDTFYFVHSYYAELHVDTVAACEYIHRFSASLQHKNFYATQFHPEKSASAGEKILNNFLEL